MKLKQKPFNRLFFNVYVNYALLLILFAVLLGFIYMNLYQDATKKDYKNQLKGQAVVIAERMSEFVRNEDYENGVSEVEKYGELMLGDIWTIPNPHAVYPMNSIMASVNLQGEELAPELIFLIDNAYQGVSLAETYYSAIHACTMISASSPILGKNREVCGAVILNVPLEAQDEIVNRSFSMIFFSVVVAAIISIIIAALFVRNLTKPIMRMRETALKLSEGKYETKTEIDRKDEIGDLARTIDFLTDKLQENEKVRNNLEQMRFDFFANVSHELRTPITVVRAYTESLVDGVVTDEEKTKQYYERMLAECKSMERLVGDLLLLSKMQNPDFTVEREPVNLMQIIEEVTRGAKAMSDEKYINIEVLHDRSAYMMFGDYDRIRQMFLVILDNAIKFSPEHSNICITLHQADKIYISIKDEGIGISDEELAYIFEKFYRSKLRQNAKGSGLGLSIAKQIVLKHGGEITVKSKVGEGTEFIFIFDCIKDEELWDI